MERRRRSRIDPLASQPRSPTRRPGDFNEQTRAELDPNIQFIGPQSSAVGPDPTDSILRLFGAIRRALSRRRRGQDGRG